jgi:hypothetical protein
MVPPACRNWWSRLRDEVVKATARSSARLDAHIVAVGDTPEQFGAADQVNAMASRRPPHQTW